MESQQENCTITGTLCPIGEDTQGTPQLGSTNGGGLFRADALFSTNALQDSPNGLVGAWPIQAGFNVCSVDGTQP